MRRHWWAAIGASIGASVVVLALASAAPAGAGALAKSPTRANGRVGAAECASNRAAGQITFVSPFGFDASAGILDVFAARALGYFADECLRVSFVTNSYTPTELVSAGAGTITGEGSAADDLLHVADGARVTAIATYGDTSDYALLTAPQVPSLKALEGEKVAYHEILPAILRELLIRAGVKLSKVDFVDDTSYNPTLLDAGAFQGLQAYQSNEPLELNADHLGYHEYTPAEYQIRGTFNVVVVNSAFLRRHRSAVADFLRAELHAFDYCTTHAAACVGFEDAAARAAGATTSPAISLKEWKLESSLATRHHLPGQGVGVETTAEWGPEARLLGALGLVRHVPSLGSAEDTTLAASLYDGSRLVWPGP